MLSGVLVVSVVCLVIYWCFFRRRQHYNPPLPPSPAISLPIIGHFHLLNEDMRVPFRAFRKKCGDVYSLQLGSTPTVVVSGAAAFKEAFKTNGDQFPMRPVLTLLDRVTRGMGIITTNGPGWREHRRFALSTLKDFGMGKSKLETKIQAEASTFVDEIDALDGAAFDPKPFISSHVASIICSMSFGVNFEYTDTRFQQMLTMMDQNMKSNAGIANFIPWLSKIPGDPIGIKRSIRNSDAIFAYSNDIIKEHIDNFDENDINDLTTAYIKELKRIEANGEETTFSYDFLGAMISDLFIAGSETTTTVLRWSLVALVNFPAIQDRMFREIEDHVGTSRVPSVQDRTNLKYVEAFYMEVLRYCNLTIFGLFHCSSEDVVIQGYTIPAGTMVVPETDSIYTDPEVWTDPEVFRPDRFLGDDGNLVNKDEFFPFFLGKRSCIGEALARMELLLFISTLVQRFKFESAPGENLTLDNADGVFGIVHTPKPYKIVARRR